MTVQELIDVLNKIEDKSKDVIYFNGMEIEEVKEYDYEVAIY